LVQIAVKADSSKKKELSDSVNSVLAILNNLTERKLLCSYLSADHLLKIVNINTELISSLEKIEKIVETTNLTKVRKIYANELLSKFTEHPSEAKEPGFSNSLDDFIVALKTVLGNELKKNEEIEYIKEDFKPIENTNTEKKNHSEKIKKYYITKALRIVKALPIVKADPLSINHKVLNISEFDE